MRAVVLRASENAGGAGRVYAAAAAAAAVAAGPTATEVKRNRGSVEDSIA